MEERVKEEPFELREQWHEESAEETEVEETYTPAEILVHEMDELDCRMYNMKEYDVQTLKAC
ncbi:hypothetical protein A2U01_0109411, partial [Trifolium medium]|nr:hypothetical protein [Trifolium medium]